jgi:hypothetical protein
MTFMSRKEQTEENVKTRAGQRANMNKCPSKAGREPQRYYGDAHAKELSLNKPSAPRKVPRPDPI